MITSNTQNTANIVFDTNVKDSEANKKNYGDMMFSQMEDDPMSSSAKDMSLNYNPFKDRQKVQSSFESFSMSNKSSNHLLN